MALIPIPDSALFHRMGTKWKTLMQFQGLELHENIKYSSIYFLPCEGPRAGEYENLKARNKKKNALKLKNS